MKTIDRRTFLKGSGGALFTIAASGSLANSLFSISSATTPTNTQASTAKSLIGDVLRQRFPDLDIPNTLVSSLSQLIQERNTSDVGPTGVTQEMVLDSEYAAVSMEQYVIREFVLNSNYTLYQVDNSTSLEFIRFENRAPMA